MAGETGSTTEPLLPQPNAGRRAAAGDAARRAQHANGGGRVLSVRPVSGGYHVKLLKHGEVRIVIVPNH